MKALILIAMFFSTSSFAFDLGKILENPKNMEQMRELMALSMQAPKDRSCETLLNPDQRQALWQYDKKVMQLSMKLALNQRASAIADIDTEEQQIHRSKMNSQISQGVSLQHLLSQSQQCLIKSLDWDNICSNNQPTLADQCNAKIDLKYWVSQDWQCADHSEQCTQKLPLLQTTQQASRQLAEWALDNASAIEPSIDRSKLKLFFGLLPK